MSSPSFGKVYHLFSLCKIFFHSLLFLDICFSKIYIMFQNIALGNSATTMSNVHQFSQIFTEQIEWNIYQIIYISFRPLVSRYTCCYTTLWKRNFDSLNKLHSKYDKLVKYFARLRSVGEWEAEGSHVQLNADALLPGASLSVFRRLRHSIFWTGLFQRRDFRHRVESCSCRMYYCYFVSNSEKSPTAPSSSWSCST